MDQIIWLQDGAELRTRITQDYQVVIVCMNSSQLESTAVIEAIITNYQAWITVYGLDINNPKSLEITKQYNIFEYPSVLFFEAGKICGVFKISGARVEYSSVSSY